MTLNLDPPSTTSTRTIPALEALHAMPLVFAHDQGCLWQNVQYVTFCFYGQLFTDLEYTV